MAATPPHSSQPKPIPFDDILQPDTAPGDTPDFADEFTTSGTEKNYWKNPSNRENFKELLI